MTMTVKITSAKVLENLESKICASVLCIVQYDNIIYGNVMIFNELDLRSSRVRKCIHRHTKWEKEESVRQGDIWYMKLCDWNANKSGFSHRFHCIILAMMPGVKITNIDWLKMNAKKFVFFNFLSSLKQQFKIKTCGKLLREILYRRQKIGTEPNCKYHLWCSFFFKPV